MSGRVKRGFVSINRSFINSNSVTYEVSNRRMNINLVVVLFDNTTLGENVKWLQKSLITLNQNSVLVRLLSH